jgi:hypothetical protein
MTMAIGFLCRDGVVIGADRQVTGRNYTFPECKISGVKWKNGRSIYGYSGNRDTHTEFEVQLVSRFTPDTEIDDAGVKSLLRETLTATGLAKREQFFVLFGYAMDNSAWPCLLQTSGSSRVVPIDEIEVIGYADSPLARYLLGTFKDVPHSVTVHQARIYAAYFIAQARRYDGQFVGDGIDIYSIDQSDRQGWRTYVSPSPSTEGIVQEASLIRYWMDVLFSMATDKENPMRLDQFKERLKAFRQSCGGEPVEF